MPDMLETPEMLVMLEMREMREMLDMLETTGNAGPVTPRPSPAERTSGFAFNRD